MTAGPRSSSKRFDALALQGARLHYLLDLTWAGRLFRLSLQPLEVTSTDTGEVLQYDGALESTLAFEEAISLFSSSADAGSVPVTCVLPVDVAELVEQGHDLLQATGELSLWIEGSTYEARRVLLRGRLAEPEYGWEGEPINATLQADASEDRALVPALAHVISTDTWPFAITNTVGLSYPLVFGSQPSSGVGFTSLSPAYNVRAVSMGGVGDMCLIAGHPVRATSVVVSTGPSSATLPVVQIADGLGVVVSAVQLDPSALAYGPDDVFMCAWGTAGAMPNKEGTGPLTGAGDVLEYLLMRSTVPVDLGRVAAAKPYLNRFKLAGVLAESTSPLEFVTSNLSPILPMSLVIGASGMYPIPWRYDATAADAVERLDLTADPTIEQVGPVVYDGSFRDVVNEFKLDYALRLRTGDMRGSITLGPRTATGASSTSTALSAASVYCRQSELRYGLRSMQAETTVVYDSATAGLIVAWWARSKSLPSRLLTYRVGYDRAWLERGDVVSVTDPDLHFVDRVALIESIETDAESLVLGLRILDDVARHLRAAGA